MEYIIALDPGKTVGWAKFTEGKWLSGQLEDWETWMFLDFNCGPDCTLIVERFQFRQLPKVDLSPVECIGVIKEWGRQNQHDIVWQTPAMAKSFFTDEHLKERGLYEKGLKHAMDAIRHILYYQKAFVK